MAASYQLRRYRLKPGTTDEFVKLWTDQVVPVRQRFGFRVVGGWTIAETEEFVWILGHDDFDAADQAYYESPERAAIDPAPTSFIDEITTAMLTPVEGFEA